MSTETRQYADGTSVTQRYPFGLYVSARALCADGKVRTVSRIAETADTFFSVPASVKVRGRTVAGFISFATRSGLSTATDADPLRVLFTAYSYRKNAGLLAPSMPEQRGPTLAERHARSLAHYPPALRAPGMYAEIARGQVHAFGAVPVLNIDAWRDGSGWTWNNWHRVGLFPVRLLDLKPRAMLREMRARGFLSAASAGRVEIADDGYNVEFRDRATAEPLFAIEYGSTLL